MKLIYPGAYMFVISSMAKSILVNFTQGPLVKLADRTKNRKSSPRLIFSCHYVFLRLWYYFIQDPSIQSFCWPGHIWSSVPKSFIKDFPFSLALLILLLFFAKGKLCQSVYGNIAAILQKRNDGCALYVEKKLDSLCRLDWCLGRTVVCLVSIEFRDLNYIESMV